MAGFVLDSDTVTYVLQRQPTVVARLVEVVRGNAEVYLCPVVHYQVRRGLLHRGASRQIQEFDSFVETLIWAELERAMWDDAAKLWAGCRARGLPHVDDADLLIAAYARRLQAAVVTNNTRDFEALGVPLVNWVV